MSLCSHNTVYVPSPGRVAAPGAGCPLEVVGVLAFLEDTPPIHFTNS